MIARTYASITLTARMHETWTGLAISLPSNTSEIDLRRWLRFSRTTLTKKSMTWLHKSTAWLLGPIHCTPMSFLVFVKWKLKLFKWGQICSMVDLAPVARYSPRNVFLDAFNKSYFQYLADDFWWYRVASTRVQSLPRLRPWKKRNQVAWNRVCCFRSRCYW